MVRGSTSRNVQQLQKYESGTNRISAGRLQTISQILDVPVSFFYDDGHQASKSPKQALKSFVAPETRRTHFSRQRTV
jgi:transcriptional regulator with XRE-family HTH domain